MKISINPLRVTEKERLSILLDDLKNIQDMLARIKIALNKQKHVLDLMDSINQKNKDSDSELLALADELDRISANCKESGIPLLDGRYSKGCWSECSSSMWFVAGLHHINIERIFIGTMTSASLELRSAGRNNISMAKSASARLKLDKLIADVEGHSSRIRFTSASWEESPLASYSSTRIERNVKEQQIEMIRTAKKSISVIHNILSRIKELAVISAGKNSSERLFIQVEVSALVDEVDRISSQTFFNRLQLLNGNYSKSSCRASLWFFQEKEGIKKKRIFIKTITAASLGLSQYGRCTFNLDNEGRDISPAMSLITGSMAKTSCEINNLQEIISELEKTDDVKIQDFIINGKIL